MLFRKSVHFVMKLINRLLGYRIWDRDSVPEVEY